MKKLGLTCIFLVFSMIVLPFFIADSYALVPFPRSDPSLHEVSLQLLIRDSNGYVVAYLEPSVMYIPNIHLVHQFLKTVPNKTVTIDGKSYVESDFGGTFVFNDSGQMATYQLMYGDISPLLFRHDGYIAKKGDTIEVSWKILSTVSP